MIKKGFRKKVLAGMLAAVTVLGAALEFPVEPQTVYAEDVGLPEETNTSFATARDLVFGTSMAGTVSESNNKRYYKFSLNEAGTINFGLDRSEYYGYTYMRIYDASQTEIYSYYTSDTSFSLGAIYLTGGNYYMMVSASLDTTFSFIATMDTTGESFTETQDSNNDMASNASAISLQKKYKGVLAANDDIDYFAFQVPAAGQITLNLTNSTSDTVAYGIYDDSVNPTYTNALYSGNKVSQPVLVKKGTYYLAVA